MADEKKAKADAPDTPSGIAAAEVGEPKAKASDEELNAHAERYAEAKRKARWG
jgi:hypothetical protein